MGSDLVFIEPNRQRNYCRLFFLLIHKNISKKTPLLISDQKKTRQVAALGSKHAWNQLTHDSFTYGGVAHTKLDIWNYSKCKIEKILEHTLDSILHLYLQWKFKLLLGKFTWGNKAKHCWALSTMSKVCWQHPTMFCP